MIWLLVPTASAAKILTCDYGDSLESIVGIARRETGPATIYVTDTCSIDGIDYLDFYPGASISEYTVVSDDSSAPRELPPIKVSGGATVSLQGMYFKASSTSMGIDTRLKGLFAEPDPAVDIYVEDGSLQLFDVTFQPGDGAGVIVVDGDLHGEGVTISGFDTYRPIYVVSLDEAVAVDMTDLSLSRNGAGGVYLYGYAGGSLALTSPTFSANGPADGADLYAEYADAISVSNGTFDSSDGGAGAPVYLLGSSMECDACTFSGTSGVVASTVAAYLESGDLLELGSSVFAPSNTDDPVMHVDTGGTFQVYGSTFTGAGRIDRYGGSTYLGTSRFSGAEGSPDSLVISLFGTNAVLDGLTICDYPGTGWGLIGVYVSTFELYDSVLQGLDMGGDPIVRAWDSYGDVDLDIRDNTVAGSDAVFVGGYPARLSYTNNLLADVAGGIALGDSSASVDEGYNLWWQVDDPLTDGSPDGTDVIDQDPLFRDDYDPTVCGTYPWLQAGSPADGAGDPSRSDGYGNTPSDIGAIDYNGGSSGDDTGTTGPGDDTGVATDDTGGPGDSGGVDSVPGDGLGPVVVSGALHPCGCDKGTPAFLLVLLPFARRRR